MKRLPVLLALFPLLVCERAAAQMTPVPEFGSNPGALNMYEYAPGSASDDAPLVVVLHGCSQSASSMLAAGWNALADAYGFYVVYAEQTSENNPMTCFNWAGEYGDPTNMERGGGENQSIKEMVDSMKARYSIDPDRVAITGFSAGGAMTAVMLATWPDVFSAGAIMSGVPYRCAFDVDSAYACQQINNNPARKKTPAEWGDLVRAAVPGYAGPYPRVALWHGTADTYIVHHDNLVELTEQWTDVHGLSETPTTSSQVAGHEYRAFEAGGRVVVESYFVNGMGHAVAMGGQDSEYPCQGSGAFFTDTGICSTYLAAEFLGLLGGGGSGGGGGGGGGEPDPDPGAEPSGGCALTTTGDHVGARLAWVLLLGCALLRIRR